MGLHGLEVAAETPRRQDVSSRTERHENSSVYGRKGSPLPHTGSPDYTVAFMLEITQSETAPGTVVVILTGKVMMGAESEPIVTLIDRGLSAGKRTFIFDLSGVTRMDSTGVGRFIYSFNKISAAGGTMRMEGAVGHIFDIFHVSLLDTVIPFFPSLEEAQAAGA